jgi:transposase
MVQLAWRFLLFQKDSALAQWYRARTADARSGTRKTLIVALARKLLIALWHFVMALRGHQRGAGGRRPAPCTVSA